jgi:hypothetical protein
MSHGDRFFRILGVLLIGYALIGKGFAYIGFGGIYVGEIAMLYGVAALLASENWSRIFRTAWLWPLVVYMSWCAFRTAPYLTVYGTDALRDAAFWMWGTFAIVVSSLVAAQPKRLVMIEGQFRFFGKWFLLLAPISWALYNFLEDLHAPWADVPLFLVKGGDMMVHLTAVFAYAVLVGIDLPNWGVVAAMMVNLVLNFTGRAGMLTFGAGAAVVTAMRPKSPIVLALFPAIIGGVFLLWVLDIHVATAGGNKREISSDQVFQNIQSIFADSDNDVLSGSKEWRLLWWDTIIRYTIHGRYFWTGKGFGVNLADDDGFQVNKDDSLRSPHNGHLTMLARAGVPGLALWIVVQLTWILGVVSCGWSALWRHERRWFTWFIVLMIYWVAFMVNASFDVYLEGPTGGIWMWSVYGVGIGAIWCYRNCPQALDEPVSQSKSQSAGRLSVCAS